MILNLKFTFFKANEAVWLALHSCTGNLFLCILFISVDLNFPTASGPNNNQSFTLITPFRQVPLTTVPTPYFYNFFKTIFNKNGCQI